jgi:cellulose biosynthesis protein BcsQ
VGRTAARYADLILPVRVRETVRAAEAPSHHLPLLACRPDSSAAEDYRRLGTSIAAQRKHNKEK